MVKLGEQFEQKKKEYIVKNRNDYNHTVTQLNKEGGVQYIKQCKLDGKSISTIAKENNTTTDHIHHYLRSKGKTWKQLPSKINKERVLRIDRFRQTLLTQQNYHKLKEAGLNDNDIKTFFNFIQKKEYENFINKILGSSEGDENDG